jgi:hypothetical protein
MFTHRQVQWRMSPSSETLKWSPCTEQTRHESSRHIILIINALKTSKQQWRSALRAMQPARRCPPTEVVSHLRRDYKCFWKYFLFLLLKQRNDFTNNFFYCYYCCVVLLHERYTYQGLDCYKSGTYISIDVSVIVVIFISNVIIIIIVD